jgi:UDP-N-acetylglucosamine--N-acetylmuramyl-(pentapeptide) pyrophosphoryl-undecaprenol N-acetylglucosamine transferase
MRIVLTGGGTGGHLFPLIAVAAKIKEKNPEVEFLFIGPDGKMEKEIMGATGVRMKKIVAGKRRRYFSPLNFLDFFKTPIGVLQSLWHLLVFMPDAVFGKGGYGSFPVVLAAWAYRIPVLIHESDSRPGTANIVMSKFAKRVAIGYAEAEKYFPSGQAVLTGNPVRSDINQGNAENARQTFHLLSSKKVIFIEGGSQGAKNINDKILNILPELLRKYQLIHQTGEKNFDEVKRHAGELGTKAGYEGYHPVAFYGDEIKDILAVADLVISRAGAGSISEIAACGKASILIPLPTSANDHQRMNAYSIAKVGGCVVIEEGNLGENMLMDKIDEIMEKEDLAKKLSETIALFHHPDAADRIAEGILGMIK